MAKRCTQNWRRMLPPLVVCLTLLGRHDCVAQPLAVPSNVRPVSARVAEALRYGLVHSSTVTALVETLDAGNVFVYLHDGNCAGGVESCLLFGAGSPQRRIVRLNFAISSARSNKRIDRFPQLVASLAHELRHAVEIASDPTVVDAASLERAYRRVGVVRVLGRGLAFETLAAAQVELDVLAELRRPPRLATR